MDKLGRAMPRAVGAKSYQRNNAFDYVRVLAFCGVVALHVVTPDAPFSVGMNVLARFAVPFFFSLAGFFSLGIPAKKLLRRIVSTARLCLIGIVLYTITAKLGITPGIDEFLAADGIGRLITNFIIWNSYPTAYPLWFLFALLYVYCFALASTVVKASPRDVICLGLGIFIARLFLSELTQAVDPLGDEMRSWLFFGIPFYCLGLLFRLRIETLRGAGTKHGFLLVFLGCLLSFIECGIFGLQEVYVGTILMIVGCYIVCIKHPMVSFRTSPVTRALSGGKSCLIAYLLHYAFITGFTKIMDSFGLEAEGLISELCLMTAVIVFSLAAGIATTRLQAIRRFETIGRETRRQVSRR